MNLRNSSLVTQPLGFAASIHPGGPSATKCSLKYFLGKMKRGGTLLPEAMTANTRVTRLPLSPDVRAPTCFDPFSAITFTVRWTVVTPISSIFQMSLQLKFYFSYTVDKLSKNPDTLCLLNDVILPKFVFSGVLIARDGFLFITLISQSFDALLFSYQLSDKLI